MLLVYGLKKSGISITKLFEKKNLEYKIWDDDIDVRKKLELKYNKKIFFNPKINDLNIFKAIFVSPGISLRQKEFLKLSNQSKLKRDLNIYGSNLKNQKVIAITGTNGKSTTTKLIGEILKKNNLKTFVGGNIGYPLCNAFVSNKNYKFHVIELSSFQLETIKNFKSKISIITNLSHDHLDRYKNIKDYINQKKNIITNTGMNLISIDDKYSNEIFSKIKTKNKISFSTFDETADCYMNSDFILDNYFKKSKKIYLKNISKDLFGNFNNQNILIAYICVKILKLPEKVFFNVIKNFKGLPFRSNIVFSSKNLKIINNSKSTNINSAINSVQNYNKILLILGGIAKEKNFKSFLYYKDKINCVYLFGKSANYIEKHFKKKIKVKKFKNLKFLIEQLFKDIRKTNIKSNVLFAPACSSFDQYKNFEERGKDFNNLIKQYLKDL